MKQSICLNMIVKNESAVIERCLNSVKPIIDTWVIVDTGSTDATCETIASCMQEIPGTLYRRRWVDFSYNRNEAMSLAKKQADYLLFIDADEYLTINSDFRLDLDRDAYYIATILPANIQFYRMLLINNHLDWKWEGIIHEALYSPDEGRTCAILEGITNVAISDDGHRSRDPNKYLNDARILKNALKNDPQNSRYVFFLAQSYFQAKEYKESLRYYEMRASMGGFEEEIYFSYYMSGILQESLNMPPTYFLQNYEKAYQTRSSRAEPLYRMAQYYVKKEQYDTAQNILVKASELPIPNTDSINVERDIYTEKIHRLLDLIQSHLTD